MMLEACARARQPLVRISSSLCSGASWWLDIISLGEKMDTATQQCYQSGCKSVFSQRASCSTFTSTPLSLDSASWAESAGLGQAAWKQDRL